MEILILVLTSVAPPSHGLRKQSYWLLLAALDKQIVLLINAGRGKLVLTHA